MSGARESEATEPPRELLAFEGVPVTVLVGPEKRLFVAHGQLLCEYSLFFKKALNGNFKEEVNREVELPEVDAIVFNTFLQWLYQDTDITNDTLCYDDDFESFDFSCSLVVKMCALADYLQSKYFMNAIFHCILDILPDEKRSPLLCADNIPEVYRTTPPDCALRRLIVRVYIYTTSQNPSRSDPAVVRSWIAECPQEFRDARGHKVVRRI